MRSYVAAVTVGVVLAGQCTPDDHEFWSSYDQSFSDFLTGCAKKEWGSAEKTTQCLLSDPHNDLSAPCATCFGDYENCAKDECWFHCMWDSTSNWCLNCIDGSKCRGQLETCTGYGSGQLPPRPLGKLSSLPALGQCSARDHDFWSSYGQTFSDFLTGCAKKEWGNAEKTTRCLLDDPMNKLSQPCASCFGDFQNCAKDECWYTCMWSSTSSSCLSCIDNSKCPGELATCSGYTAKELPPNPSTHITSLPTTTMAPTTSTTATITSTTTVAPSTTSAAPSTTSTTSSASRTTPSTTTAGTTPMAEGNCTAADHNLWTNYGQAYGNYIAFCGKQSFGDADATTKCLEKSGLTSTCSACFGQSVQCGRDKCMFKCLVGPTTSKCLDCIAKTECDPDLYKCAGYPASQMPPAPNAAYSNYIAYCGKQAWGSADVCFGQSVQCGRDKCMFKCLSGPTTSKCLNCIAKTECDPDLYKCTGYPAAEMPPEPTAVEPLPARHLLI
ncbi:hypothetical protein FOZ61_007758 [Perkinsus olseni]|uniref:Immunoglobulin super DCC subclass member n=1 Tax=Perkinsus olseni TaxID=32597 RepID=A0A7J6L7H3_PEROL|nr:hypothetical protein FOZ61_007758 [Perkinsus olseni]